MRAGQETPCPCGFEQGKGEGEAGEGGRMGLRETLRKAAGLLVELPPEAKPAGGSSAGELDDLLADLEGRSPAAPKTVEQIVRETDGPNLDQITVPTGGA